MSLLKKPWFQDLLVYGTILVIVLLILFGLISGIQSAADSYSEGEVHWHAAISYEACGKTLTFDDETVDHGGAVIHGHNDGKVHVEGVVPKPTDITLQEFFNTAKLNITSEHLDTYKNGDFCPLAANPGQVHFYVDEEEVLKPEDLVIQDGQTIKVIFQ